MTTDQSTGRVFPALEKPLEDCGFANSKAARAVIRERIRQQQEQSLSRSRASIATVLQFIDQRVQTGCNVGPVINEIADDLAGYRKGMIAKRAIESIGCCEMGEEELLESVDAILQFLKLVLINCGHSSESPDAVGPDLPTPTPNAPHCLSETPE